MMKHAVLKKKWIAGFALAGAIALAGGGTIYLPDRLKLRKIR